MEPLLQSQCIPYLQGLTKKGISFTLLSFEKQKTSRQEMSDSVSYFKNRLAQYGIKWYWLPYHKRPSLPATLFDIFCGLIFSCYLVIKRRVNIVHARATIPAVIALILKKVFRLKFIFDMRGINAEEYVDAGIWSRASLKYRVFSLIEKKVLRAADSIVVLTDRASQIVRRDYIPDGNADIRVIPCCVDLSIFGSCGQSGGREVALNPRSKEGFTLVYSGSIGTWYMLEEMLDFFVILQEYISNAHFLILARSEKEMIEKTINRRQTSSGNRVRVMTSVYSEMPGYLCRADAGIFFIRPTLSKQASCPIKMGEYLACGLPIISNTGIGDVAEIISSRNIGIVVEGFSWECYSGAVKKLTELLKEGAALRQRCRAAARDYFSLEGGVEKYWQVYQQLRLKQ